MIRDGIIDHVICLGPVSVCVIHVLIYAISQHTQKCCVSRGKFRHAPELFNRALKIFLLIFEEMHTNATDNGADC